MDPTLSIMPWNTCNARCAHCGPDSGPHDKTGLSHNRVLELIRDASEEYQSPWCLSLSGGEIFLYYDRLLEYCKTASEGGGYTTLITNCYWAKTVERAKELLKPLIDNKLLILGVSYDKFHDPYIDPEYVKNAIRAARELHLKCHVRSVATKSNRMVDVMQRLTDGHLWYVDFMEMPCVPAGRAIKEVSADELIFADEFPAGRCPAASLTINPKGDGMICCNSAGEIPEMNVGNVKEHSLPQLEDSFRFSPLVGFLCRKGPAAALDFLSDDEKLELKEKQYVSVCHLCHDIFNDEERRRKILNEVNESTWQQLTKSMPSLAMSLDLFLEQEIHD
ncbi:radical SAM protein [Gimesia chilikensis]|uniref:radical SAM protein n=1 Tax=Gimesia chilikensis TaxID=2605989 RepID=UPI003A8D81EC